MRLAKPKVCRPVKREVLSNRAYVNTYKEQKNNIKKTRVIPPKLGRHDWGRILVEYYNPILK